MFADTLALWALGPSVPLAVPSGSASQAVPDAHASPRLADATQATIAIIDDEATNIKVVSRLLNIEGFTRFATTTDAREGFELIQRAKPDLVLLDLMMPHTSGLEILHQIRSTDATAMVPVIILTASTDHATRIEALQRGANDFLNKPIDPSELTPRIRNLLLLKMHQDRLEGQAEELDRAVQQRTAQLEASRRDLIYCLARATEYRDDDTGFHVVRVGKYALRIAEGLGLGATYAETIEQAAQLHDVGKIGVPDDVLRKPGKLTEEEFETIRQHCGFGKHILQRLSPDEEKLIRNHATIGAQILDVGHSPILEMAMRIALTHHEWWDGTGYPLGLRGEDIPLEGRITAVADVFDALSTRRCYKKAIPLERCFEIMREERGTHFDPQVLDAFFDKRREILEIQLRYADER